MGAVVVDVVGVFLTVLYTADAATDGGFTLVVFAQILRVGQHGFKELEGLNHVAFVVDGHDAVHTNVLDDAQVGEVFLPEGHPEAGALDGGKVEDEAFDFLMVEEIALARADVGIGEGLVDFEGLGFHPFAIFPVESFLRDFADVDFGVEVGGKRLAVVAGIAVDDVEVVDFVEMVLGGVGGVDARHTGVETATEDGAKSCLFEAFAESPLPGVLKVCLVLRFVVGSVEVVATSL